MDVTMERSQDSQAGSDQAMQLPDVQYTITRLTETHQQLFDQMKQEQAALLRNTENIDQQVGVSTFSQLTYTRSVALLLSQQCGQAVHWHDGKGMMHLLQVTL